MLFYIVFIIYFDRKWWIYPFVLKWMIKMIQNNKKLPFSVFFIVSFIKSYRFYRFKWHLSNRFYRASIIGLWIIVPNDKGHFLISAGVCLYAESLIVVLLILRKHIFYLNQFSWSSHLQILMTYQGHVCLYIGLIK